jgi:hypothetical protein
MGFLCFSEFGARFSARHGGAVWQMCRGLRRLEPAFLFEYRGEDDGLPAACDHRDVKAQEFVKTTDL